MTTVYVIMGNDYPAAVISRETVAKVVVDKLRAHEDEIVRKAKEGHAPICRGKIHWRYYGFVLDQEPALRNPF